MDNNLLGMWSENWSSTDSEESVYSDDSLSSPKMEAVHVNHESLLLPEDMCEREDIFKEILSAETWNNLTEEQRKHLETFLPTFPENDAEEKAKSLEMLFSGQNIRFGNPLDEFYSNLHTGFYRPDISKMRAMLRKTKMKDYRRREKWRIAKLVKSVVLSRARLASAWVNGDSSGWPAKSCRTAVKGSRSDSATRAVSSARFSAEMALIRTKSGDDNQSTDDDDPDNILPESNVNLLKRSRRKEFSVATENGGTTILGTLSSGPNPWDHTGFPATNPYLTDRVTAPVSKLLSLHCKRRARNQVHPGLLTDDITVDDVATRCRLVKRPVPPASSNQSNVTRPAPSKKAKIKVEEEEAPIEAAQTPVASRIEDQDTRIDIEAVDDSVSPPSFITPPQSGKAAKVNSTRRSEEPPVRKLSLEAVLDGTVGVAARRPDSGGTAARRPRAESSDSHFRLRLDSPSVQPLFPRQVPAKSSPVNTPRPASTPRPATPRVVKAETASIVKPLVALVKGPPKMETKPVLETKPTLKPEPKPHVVKTEPKPHIKPELKPHVVKTEPKPHVIKTEPKPHIVKMELKPHTIKVEDKSGGKETSVAEVVVPLPSFKKLKSDAEQARASGGSDSTWAQLSTPPQRPRPPTTTVRSSSTTTTPSLGGPLRGMTPATLSDLKGIDMMALPVDIDESSVDDVKVKAEEAGEHACFFSLIRDIITSTPDDRIEAVELEARVRAWALSPQASLHSWVSHDLTQRLSSALQFLTGDLTELVPDEYVPYMEYKPSLGAYQWIGAGRDSDHRLIALCSAWEGGGQVARVPCTPGTGSVQVAPQAIGVRVDGGAAREVVLARAVPPVPPDLTPRGPAVQPTSPSDRQLFRIQESERYSEPGRAFTYRVGGVTALVGPVRAAGQSVKARGHSLLVADRPRCVTILELVRDAVARLPLSHGTRADIVTLLKDSQYLLADAAENVLSSVVSGALDRLHSEADPSVKYDPKRKIWVYLHAGRPLEEFERLHSIGVESRAAAAGSRAKSRGKGKNRREGEEAGDGEARPRATPSKPRVGASKAAAASTSALSASSPAPVKKAPALSTHTLSTAAAADSSAQTKSIVKVIATAQPASATQVGGRGKTDGGQVLVMKGGGSAGGGETGQVLVLGASSSGTTGGAGGGLLLDQRTTQRGIRAAANAATGVSDQTHDRQGAATIALQQQLQQLILAKQQQLLGDGKGGKGGQQVMVVKPAADKQAMILLKGAAGSAQDVKQMILVQQQEKGSSGSEQLQQLLLKGPSGDVQPVSQSQLQALLKGPSSESKGDTPQLQALLKQTSAQQTDPPVHLQQQLHPLSQQQLHQLIAKHPSETTTQVQQISQQQLQQLLVKQAVSESSNATTTTTAVQQISQQQLQQLLLKQQQQQQQQHQQQQHQQQQQQPQQMIIVKQHDQKQIQVITSQSAKTGTLALAQLQQLQQKTTNASGLLATSPRVVAASRMQPGRGALGQFAVVSLPQSQQTHRSVPGSDVKGAQTTAGRLTAIPGKQLLLAAPSTATTTKTSSTTQSVVVGTTGGGQAVLVGGAGGASGLAVLQQGTQQILIPSNTLNLKTLQALKVIPIAATTTRQSGQGGRGPTGGGQQVFARLVTGGPPRAVATTQAQAPPTSHQDAQTGTSHPPNS